MYELKNGTYRLVFALECIKEDKTAIKALSRVMNYNPEQLEEDIQALADYIKIARQKIKEDNEL